MKLFSRLLAIVFSSWLALSFPLQANIGEVDPSFGGSGFTHINFAAGSENANDIVIQPDGKQVVIGESGPKMALEGYHITLIRCLADGTLDSSFGDHGKVITPLGRISRGRKVLLQPDGKLIAGAEVVMQNYPELALLRYLPDGSLDDSFGIHGRVTLDLGVTSHLVAIRLLSDGKILLAAQTVTGNTTRMTLARYLPSGAPDLTFDGEGLAEFSDTASFTLNDMIVQNDGKIVVAGARNDRLTVWRFLPHGEIDTSFNSTGRAESPLANSSAEAIVFQQGGVAIFDSPSRILVTGSARTGNQTSLLLSRLTLDGKWDTTFGSAGTVLTSIESYTVGRDLLVESARLLRPTHIIVAADTRRDANNRYGLAIFKFTMDGTLESSFGQNGITLTYPGASSSYVNAMVLSNGRLTLAGYAANDARGSDIALVRFLSDTGKLDLEYGERGYLLIDLPNEGGYASDLVSLPSGRLLISGGTRLSRTYSGAYVTGMQEDGTLDFNFGVLGRTSSPVGYNTPQGAVALAARPDGRFYAVGTYDPSGPSGKSAILVMRFLPDGRPDSEFRTTGDVIIRPGTNHATVNDVSVTPDGGAIVVGTHYEPDGSQLALMRFQPDGFLQSSFANQGTLIISISETFHSFSRVCVQKDGKILVSATCGTGEKPLFGLMRLHPDGKIDIPFGLFGRVTTALGSQAFAYDLALQPNQRILVAGSVQTGNTTGHELAIVRYLPDGRVDSSFGNQGQLLLPLGLAESTPVRLKLQADDKILAAATIRSGNTLRIAVVRLLSDGSFDTTFGRNGVATPVFGPATEQFVETLAFDSAGRLLLAGQLDNAAFIARLQNERWEILSLTRMNNGRLRLEGTGVPSSSASLYTSPTLLPGSFVPLGSVHSDAAGHWHFDDPNLPTLPQRFYRLQVP